MTHCVPSFAEPPICPSPWLCYPVCLIPRTKAHDQWPTELDRMNYDDFDFQEILRDIKLNTKISNNGLSSKLNVAPATTTNWLLGHTKPTNLDHKRRILNLAKELNITVYPQ